MSKKGEDLPELVYQPGEEGQGPVWECMACGEEVYRQFGGGHLGRLIEVQKEHVCPHKLAKKRLPVDRIRLREVLDELGSRVEILWTGYESAELMLVDKKTGQQLPLGSETLG